MKLLGLAGGRHDEAVINFSMARARDAAWRVAALLARLRESWDVRHTIRVLRDG